MMSNLELQRVFQPWYLDRDFPEIKSGNDDVVAVIENVKQRDRVLASQHKLLGLLNDAFVVISDLEKTLLHIQNTEISNKEVQKSIIWNVNESLDAIKDFREDIIERSAGCFK